MKLFLKSLLLLLLLSQFSYSNISLRNLKKIKFNEFNNALHAQNDEKVAELLEEYPNFIDREAIPLEEIDDENLSLFLEKEKEFSNLDRITIGKGWTPFYWAIFYGSKNLISKFTGSLRVDLNHLDTYKRNSLHIALRYSDLDVVRILLLGNVKVDKRDIHGDTPLHSLARRDNLSEIERIDILRLLFKNDYPVFRRNKQGITPLNILVKKNDLLVVDYLTRNFPFLLKEKDRKGNNPLHWAAAGSNQNVLLFLIRRGVPINSKNKEGWAPIHWAVQNKNLKTLETLIKENYNAVNLQNDFKMTALHLSVINDKINHARILLKNFADVDLQDKNGNTPLHIAVMKNRVDFVKLLLPYNPNLAVKNKKKKTPMDLVRSKEMKNLLLKLQ